MEWRSVRETGADELDKQLTIGENHDWSSLLETLLQNKLMIVLCSLLLNVVEESNKNVMVVVEKNNRNVVAVEESNRNVVAVVEKNNRNVVAVEESNGNVVVLGEKKL